MKLNFDNIKVAGGTVFDLWANARAGKLCWVHGSEEERTLPSRGFYTSDGWLRRHTARPVLECNPRCGCGRACRNRVVGDGIRFPLRVIASSSGKGWGLCCAEPLRAGSFVAEYCGEYKKEQALEGDEGNRYLLTPGVGEDVFTIDAQSKGNVARFLNHSCAPNCVAQLVQAEHNDPRVGRIGFFTMCDVPAWTELSFHYGPHYVSPSRGGAFQLRCRCARGCTSWLRLGPS
eukprot:SAG22_NODE_1380_length_4545_cov_1.918129_2_plen_232_part_00